MHFRVTHVTLKNDICNFGSVDIYNIFYYICSMEISDRIKQIMVQQGLTASALAEIIGVQRSGMSHIFSGRNKPSLDMLIKITDAFPDITLDWLVFGQENRSRSSDATKGKDSDSYKRNVSLDDCEGDNSKVEKRNYNRAQGSSEANHLIEKRPEAVMDQVIIFYNDGTFEEFTKRKRL